MLLSSRDGQARRGLGVGAQALCDGVAAEEPSGAGAEEGVAAASGTFVQPGAQQVLVGAVERDGALFATFPLAADGGAAAQSDVVAVQAGEFGDAQAGLDGQGQHGLVPSSFPAFWIRCRQQGVDLRAGQERDGPLVEPLGWDVQDPLDEQGVFGVLEGGVGEQRPDRGQADVAGSGAVAALVFQVVEERGDHVRVQVVPVQLRRGGPGPMLDEAEQEADRVAVGGDGSGAGLALAGEPFGEERLQGGCDQGHGRAAFRTPSRRAAARASSSGAADKYQ